MNISSNLAWILFITLLATSAKAQQVQITNTTALDLNSNFQVSALQMEVVDLNLKNQAATPFNSAETFNKAEFDIPIIVETFQLPPVSDANLSPSSDFLTASENLKYEPQQSLSSAQLSLTSKQTQPTEVSQQSLPPAQIPRETSPRTQPIEPEQQPTTPVEPDKPKKQVNIQLDYIDEFDNFGLRSRYLEQTTRFPLNDGNQILLKTGSNLFDEIGIEAVKNFPIQVGWEGTVGAFTLQVAGGVDLFDRLPTEPNFNAKLAAPLSPNFTLSAIVDQGPHKYGAKSLANQISAWRYGLDLAWEIDRDTDLSSSFRWGNYNDGNYEEESSTRLERSFGQFFLAGNLYLRDYKFDVEAERGYFSPAGYLFYTGELGWQGEIIEALSCRLAAHLGQERFRGDFTLAAGYEASCTAKLSSKIELDLGYFASTLYFPEEVNETEQSFTGQLRISF